MIEMAKALAPAAPKAVDFVSKKSRSTTGLRFAAVCSLVVFAISSIAGCFCYYVASIKAPQTATVISRSEPERNRDRDLYRRISELDQKVQDFGSELEQATASLDTARKESEARDILMRDGEQKVATLSKEIKILKSKIASAPAEFAKAIIAQGKDSTTPSFAPTPGRASLPPQIESPAAEPAKDGGKLRCRFLFNDYYLCEREATIQPQ